MANTIGMKTQFTVIKDQDLHRLPEEHQRWMSYIQSSIRLDRAERGKRAFNQYLVVNVDEPYADEIIKILKKHGHWG